MKVVDYEYYEFVPLSEAQEVPHEWNFEDTSDVDFEAIEEMEDTILVAEVLEELGYGL